MENLIHLTRFTKFLGLTPKYDKTKKIFLENKFQIVSGAVFFSVNIVAHLVTFQYIQRTFRHFGLVKCVLNLISIILSFFTIASTVIATNFRRGHVYLEIFNNLMDVEEKLGSFGLRFPKEKWRFYFDLLLAHSVTITINSYNIYYWFFAPVVRVNQILIIENMVKYYFLVTVIVMSNIALSVGRQFRSLNSILARFIEDDERIAIRSQDIDALQSIYLILTEQIRNFNRIFGFVVFFLFINDILVYLNLFHGAIDMPFIMTVRKSIKYIFLLWIFLYLWIITTVGVSCGSTTKEAQETRILCYELCIKLREKKSRRRSKEMLFFARLVTTTRTTFTAAGFFNVDHSMLFNALQMMTSYVVVILQLYK